MPVYITLVTPAALWSCLPIPPPHIFERSSRHFRSLSAGCKAPKCLTSTKTFLGAAGTLDFSPGFLYCPAAPTDTPRRYARLRRRQGRRVLRGLWSAAAGRTRTGDRQGTIILLLFQLSYSGISGGGKRRQEEPRRQEKEARGMRSPQVYYLTYRFHFGANWHHF